MEIITIRCKTGRFINRKVTEFCRKIDGNGNQFDVAVVGRSLYKCKSDPSGVRYWYLA